MERLRVWLFGDRKLIDGMDCIDSGPFIPEYSSFCSMQHGDLPALLLAAVAVEGRKGPTGGSD
jgi:hypothetical protein